jgi:SsrA-binding protein
LIKQQNYSLVPISLYLKNNRIKVELGIGKGKKLYDKRQDLAKKDAERKIQRAMKQYYNN